jgi:hypothetical protein
MNYKISLLLLSVTLGWIAGCKEPTIDEGILPFTEVTEVDANGGSWRTIVLRSASDISVPAPTATSSAAYQSELTAVKNGLLGTTAEQNTAVTYWAGGSVVRWNQIARQLVAKYNILPGYDAATGQVTPADSANSYAGAPFTARVYALLSVAQYDALVVAWRAKFQYNRPSLENQGVISRVPVENIPSYPSEDAAIAEVSYQVLAYLFPREANWLKAKAAEHKQSRVWAGACVPSDLKAGEDLASAVASRMLTRARSDRFASSNDPSNSWQTALAKAPYDIKWKSLEQPERTPVLPLAGKVKTWFDSASVYRSIVIPPPITTAQAFQTALKEVRDISNSRTREQWRIASYWEDGTNTYGLPGHWNYLAEDLIRQAGQNELRSARTYALLNRAMHDAGTGAWWLKYTYFVPRPSQLDASIKTATVIPNTPSYVSDHAMFSAAAAAVLGYVFPDESTVLNNRATEAALSGLYSGTQYRFDIESGTQAGAAIGKLTTDWAKADGAK